MSMDKNKSRSDECPICGHSIKLRKTGVKWEMQCVRCSVSARGDNKDTVFENWIRFRKGMERVKINKK